MAVQFCECMKSHGFGHFKGKKNKVCELYQDVKKKKWKEKIFASLPPCPPWPPLPGGSQQPSVASFSGLWKETVCYTCKEVLCISYFYHQRCRLDTLFWTLLYVSSPVRRRCWYRELPHSFVSGCVLLSLSLCSIYRVDLWQWTVTLIPFATNI